MKEQTIMKPLEDSLPGDVGGGPYGRERSSGGFYFEKGEARPWE